ncbi:MAG: SDR family oxidoreductase [Lautropia sp.]
MGQVHGPADGSDGDPGRIVVRGETVVVSGGCGAIGGSIGQRFAALGKRVVLLDIDIAKGAALARQYPNVQLVRVDLADPSALASCLDELSAGGGAAADILVNCVGVSPKLDADGNRLTFWTTPAGDWQRLFDINVLSYVLCTQQFVRPMIEKGYGRIVNIGSYAARTGGFQGAAHYQTMKNAILGMTRALAREVARFGITVNTINPGRIATPMTADVSPERNAEFAAAIPLGRLGVPEDIAKAAVFLASDMADYITGAAIEVNGGVYMGP